MRIWIDITNSPHVLVFRPLYKHLKKSGHDVFVTSRNYAQTLDLLEIYEIPNIQIGKHAGKNIIGKIVDVFSRTFNLLRFAKNKGIDIAVSHNSHHLTLASKLLDIPSVDMFDYEYAPSHHINIRLSNKVIFPSYIDYKSLEKYGCKKNRVWNYKGLKEQFYLFDFIPNKDKLKSLELDSSKIIITIRPPSDMAHYHFKENRIYPKLILYLSRMDNVQCVFLPRSSYQIDFIKKFKSKNFVIPNYAIDGPNLVYHSDILISGGGTMNREAAFLGTPAYTIFSQTLGSVDRYLMDEGYLKPLSKMGDIVLRKKEGNKFMDNLDLDSLVNQILTV